MRCSSPMTAEALRPTAPGPRRDVVVRLYRPSAPDVRQFQKLAPLRNLDVRACGRTGLNDPQRTFHRALLCSLNGGLSRPMLGIVRQAQNQFVKLNFSFVHSACRIRRAGYPNSDLEIVERARCGRDGPNRKRYNRRRPAAGVAFETNVSKVDLGHFNHPVDRHRPNAARCGSATRRADTHTPQGPRTSEGLEALRWMSVRDLLISGLR